MKVLYTFDVEPVAKPRMTRRDRWAKRPCVLRYWDFVDALKAEAVKNQYDPPDIISVCFVLPMPSSWSARKREGMRHKPHRQKPDTDNLIKAFKDALLKDDKTVHTYGFMHKCWGDVGQILILSAEDTETKANTLRQFLKSSQA